MHPRYSTPLALLFAIVASVSAFAQGTSAPGSISPEPRWYVAGIGGAVSRPPAGPVFGIEIAERLGQHAQVYATVSYFENLMRQSLRNDLEATATRLATLTGDPWSLSGRDRGLTTVAGGKYAFGGGTIRPYVGAGVGVINLRRTVSDRRLGDVTRAVFNDFDLGEGDLSLAPQAINRPLVEGAFGVEIGSGRTHFDIGYRYRAAYRMDASLNFSQVAVGIGYRF